MRHPTPHATPVAPAPRLAPFMVSSTETPKLQAPIMLLTPEGDIELQHGVAILGRDVDCDVPIRDDLASRRHARLELSSEEVTIEDLRSTNGVYLNGVRLDSRPRPLREGDRLLIGTTEISVFALRPRRPRSGNVPV